MAEENEGKLTKRILSKLREFGQKYGLKVNKEVKIASDLTCIKEKNTFKLGIGFTKVDLVIYKQISFNKSNRQLFEYFKFIQDSRKDRKYLNVPFVILELKCGQVTSDAIRARNEVARRIKNVFPFCSYIFIGENTSKKEETLFRQGKNFDNFFIFERKIVQEDISGIISKFVKPYLKNLKEIGLL